MVLDIDLEALGEGGKRVDQKSTGIGQNNIVFVPAELRRNILIFRYFVNEFLVEKRAFYIHRFQVTEELPEQKKCSTNTSHEFEKKWIIGVRLYLVCDTSYSSLLGRLFLPTRKIHIAMCKTFEE